MPPITADDDTKRLARDAAIADAACAARLKEQIGGTNETSKASAINLSALLHVAEDSASNLFGV